MNRRGMRGPGSRGYNRFSFTGLHVFKFDEAASNNGSVSTTAEGGIAVPPSVCANGQERAMGADGFHWRRACSCLCSCLCPWSQNRNPIILLLAAWLS